MRRSGLITVVCVVSVLAWGAALRAASALTAFTSELDRASELAELRPRPQATIVFDRHGRPAFSFFIEQRTDVPLSAVSPHMAAAILAVEDRRFFRHNGVDVVRVFGAAWRNIRAGRIVEGGSTITQQLARASQLTPERTFARKLRELTIAVRLEERYSKEEILEQYLNTVYFGEGLHGVEAASRGYFGKPAADLDVHEAALLSALVRSPSLDAPCDAPSRALARRNLVLRLMRRDGAIDAAQLASALARPLPDRSHHRRPADVLIAGAPGSGLYFQEELRRQLVAGLGEERVLRGGLRVYSTLDPALQRAAEDAVSSRIMRLVKGRPGARDLQGSLVAMDPQTGDVRALVGGRDFHKSPFNRATQARRQPGSAFKPIVFAAALERGYAPGSLLRDLDAPIDWSGRTWLPSGDHELAQYTLRRALKVSSNRAAAQLLRQIGVGTAIYYAQRLGIESRLPVVPSLALGTGEVTLLELTAAYTAFANQGLRAAPRLFTHVTDGNGATVWESAPHRTQAISPTTAYLLSSMLADVVSGGTGTAVRAAGFRLPAAGKTGTSDDFVDAWFVGYTPRLVAGVWFGFDDPAAIMREGFAGVVAAPAWGRFMRAAMAGAKPEWYQMPGDVEKVAICRVSGARATDACRHPAAATDPYEVRSASLTPPVSASASPDANTRASGVYEDLFPMGTMPIESCWIQHASSVAADSVATPLVPLMDDALRQAAPAGEPASRPSIIQWGIQSGGGTRIVIQRVVGTDGVTRTIARQVK